MKITIALLLSTIAGLLTPRLAAAADVPAAAPTKIGIYDSRAVAVAFAGSDAHKKQTGPIQADYAKAKQAGDEKRMKEINEQMKATQKRFHMQGFSTAPVDDILRQIEGDLPRIKKDAGVDLLVSKWDDATLAKYPSAQKIDVTMRLVDAFHPTDRQRKSAEEIQKHKPISLKEAENIND